MRDREASVLVVEDSDEDFDTVEQVARAGATRCRVERACDGDACLARLAEAGPQKPLPQLILLDLNLPGTDGRETLRELRADPRYRRVPVVVLSTTNNPRDVALCYERGANAFHVKPVHYAEHRRVVEDVFTYWLTKAVTAVDPRGDAARG